MHHRIVGQRLHSRAVTLIEIFFALRLCTSTNLRAGRSEERHAWISFQRGIRIHREPSPLAPRFLDNTMELISRREN